MSKSALSGQVERLTETFEAEFGRLEGQIEAAVVRIDALANKVATLERHTGFTPKHARDAGCEPTPPPQGQEQSEIQLAPKAEPKPKPKPDPAMLVQVGERYKTPDGLYHEVIEHPTIKGKFVFAYTGEKDE